MLFLSIPIVNATWRQRDDVDVDDDGRSESETSQVPYKLRVTWTSMDNPVGKVL